MIIKFDDAPDVDTELIDTIELTDHERRMINDNLFDLL